MVAHRDESVLQTTRRLKKSIIDQVEGNGRTVVWLVVEKASISDVIGGREVTHCGDVTICVRWQVIPGLSIKICKFSGNDNLTICKQVLLFVLVSRICFLSPVFQSRSFPQYFYRRNRHLEGQD